MWTECRLCFVLCDGGMQKCKNRFERCVNSVDILQNHKLDSSTGWFEAHQSLSSLFQTRSDRHRAVSSGLDKHINNITTKPFLTTDVFKNIIDTFAEPWCITGPMPLEPHSEQWCIIDLISYGNCVSIESLPLLINSSGVSVWRQLTSTKWSRSTRACSWSVMGINTCDWLFTA